jgi:hypothetical protein
MTGITLGEPRKWTFALWLAAATIGYNLIEGVVSLWFGLQDETLALFGFGADSFIEVISAIGVAHMIIRLRRHGDTDRDAFERTALRVTGWAFYGLTFVLAFTAVTAIVTGHQPETTIPGVVISLISIGFMWALIRAKVNVGTELKCDPIIADANCSRVCLRMSIVLLASSVIYHFTGLGFVDAIGALALAWYSFSEGKECFEKARGIACEDDCC